MPSKAKALAEAALAEAAFFLAAWYLQYIQGGGYGWTSKLFMIALALCLVTLHGSPRGYGLAPRNPRFTLRWSLYTLALFTGISVAAAAIAWLLDTPKPLPLRELVTDIVWFFVFVGFAEELFFRGYIQTLLNQAFAREYRSILGVPYRWKQGTLITGVAFFGLPHLLTGVNPFTGTIAVTPEVVSVAIFASFLGIVFGVLREKTGDIILPAVLHGSVDVTYNILAKITGPMVSGAAAFTALFIFFYKAFPRILTEPI